MLLRIIGVLVAICVLFLLSSYYFGEAVLAWLGMAFQVLKGYWAKLSWASLRAAVPVLQKWFAKQALGFVQKGFLRRWIKTFVVPLLLGAAARRWLDSHRTRVMKHLRVRRKLLMRWYRKQPKLAQLLLSVTVMLAILFLSVFVLGTWVVWFAVSIPGWVTAMFSRLFTVVNRSVQKAIFKALAAAHVFRAIDWAWERAPTHWKAPVKRVNRRAAREVFRYRRRAVLGIKKRLPKSRHRRRTGKPRSPYVVIGNASIPLLSSAVPIPCCECESRGQEKMAAE